MPVCFEMGPIQGFIQREPIFKTQTNPFEKAAWDVEIEPERKIDAFSATSIRISSWHESWIQVRVGSVDIVPNMSVNAHRSRKPVRPFPADPGTQLITIPQGIVVAVFSEPDGWYQFSFPIRSTIS